MEDEQQEEKAKQKKQTEGDKEKPKQVKEDKPLEGQKQLFSWKESHWWYWDEQTGH